MKILKLLPFVLLMLIASSCVSVKVTADYDQQTNFKEYKTFAFYKKGIDKVEISDLGTDKNVQIHHHPVLSAILPAGQGEVLQFHPEKGSTHWQSQTGRFFLKLRL